MQKNNSGKTCIGASFVPAHYQTSPLGSEPRMVDGLSFSAFWRGVHVRMSIDLINL